MSPSWLRVGGGPARAGSGRGRRRWRAGWRRATAATPARSRPRWLRVPGDRAAMLHSVSPRRTTTSSSTRVPASGAGLSRWRASGSGTGVRSGREGVQAASGAVAPAPSAVPTVLPSVAPVPSERASGRGRGGPGVSTTGRRSGPGGGRHAAAGVAGHGTSRRRHGRARGGGRRRHGGHRGAGRQGRAQAGAEQGRRQPPHRGGRERRGASGGHSAGGSRQGGEQREREREGEPRDEQGAGCGDAQEQGVSRPGRAGGLDCRPRVPQGRAEQGDRAAADEQDHRGTRARSRRRGDGSGGVVPRLMAELRSRRLTSLTFVCLRLTRDGRGRMARAVHECRQRGAPWITVAPDQEGESCGGSSSLPTSRHSWRRRRGASWRSRSPTAPAASGPWSGCPNGCWVTAAGRCGCGCSADRCSAGEVVDVGLDWCLLCGERRPQRAGAHQLRCSRSPA